MTGENQQIIIYLERQTYFTKIWKTTVYFIPKKCPIFCLKIPSTQIKTPLYTLHPKVLAYPDFLIKVILGVNYLYSDIFFFFDRNNSQLYALPSISP